MRRIALIGLLLVLATTLTTTSPPSSEPFKFKPELIVSTTYELPALVAQDYDLGEYTKPEPPPPPPAPKVEPQAAQVAPFYTGGGEPAEWMAAAGIPESDWGYVDFIVSRESGWNPNAYNNGSGASGLVQALPCGKVPGNCFDPVDNLRWADGYAKGRYGSWSQAVEFWSSNHWW